MQPPARQLLLLLLLWQLLLLLPPSQSAKQNEKKNVSEMTICELLFVYCFCAVEPVRRSRLGLGKLFAFIVII